MSPSSSPHANDDATGSAAQAKHPRHADVFISFAREDLPAAAKLRAAVEKSGFSVWWDQELQCGDDWHVEIEQAMAAAACVVVLWSDSALQSTWVRHEASQAMAYGTYAPVRIEPVDVPSPYDRVQVTSLADGSTDLEAHPGFRTLLVRIGKLAPAPFQRLLRWLVAWRGTFLILTVSLAGALLLGFLLHRVRSEVDRLAGVSVAVQQTVTRLDQVIDEVSFPTVTVAVPFDFQLSAYCHSLPGILRSEGLKKVSESGVKFDSDLLFLSIPSRSGFWPRTTVLQNWLKGFRISVDFFTLGERSSHLRILSSDVKRAEIHCDLKQQEFVYEFAAAANVQRYGPTFSVTDLDKAAVRVRLDSERFWMPGLRRVEDGPPQQSMKLEALNLLIEGKTRSYSAKGPLVLDRRGDEFFTEYVQQPPTAKPTISATGPVDAGSR